ncbi:MAG: WD40 repeat domain-containing serine/threonine protein kinase [Pirellulales bacterium]
MSATDDEIDDRLAAFLIEYGEALDSAGAKRPSAPPDADPELRADYEEAIGCLELLDRVRRLGTPGQAECETPPWPAVEPGSSPDTPAALPRTLGRFRVSHELGRGGLGIVYLAYDPKLGRQVALKIPRIESLASEEMQRRFLREAEAAARLSHPNLISVFDAGEEGPICYIASEFCPGPTLAAWLRQRAGPAPPRWAADCVRQLAAGVQHAHGRGVLHRDIKPSNILLAALPGPSSRRSAGRVEAFCPKLADFGMAKLLEHANDQTRSGALIGTPAYMAPEQASGQLRDVDARADVYALGVVLYELLTRRRPFEGASDVEIIARVIGEEPRPPTRWRTDIPRDLAAICLKCLDKEPARRYVTAQQLADDLGRFLRGEPTEARRPRTAERLWKWARRRPVIAGLSAALLLLLATLIVGSVTFTVRLQAALAKMRSVVYTGEIRLAQESLLNNHTAQALAILARHAPANDESARGDFAWQFLTNAMNRDVGRLPRHPGDVYCLAFSPDGDRLATACGDGRVRVWDWRAGQLMAELGDQQGEANCVVYSLDGRLLISGDDAGRVVIRDSVTHAKLRELRHDEANRNARIVGLVFSPDGETLYVASDNSLFSWDVATGQRLASVVASQGQIRGLAISADGRHLATAGYDMMLWRAQDFVPSTLELRANYAAVWFAPDGQALVAAQTRGILDVFDIRTGQRIGTVPEEHRDTVFALAGTADGRCLVSAGEDRVLSVCDPQSQRHLAALVGHSDRVWDVRHCPNSDRIASADAAGDVLFWETPRSPRYHYPDGAIAVYRTKNRLTTVAFSPSGHLLACGGPNTLVVIDNDLQRIRQFPPGHGELTAIGFRGDDELIGITSYGAIRGWNTRTAAIMEYGPNLVDELAAWCFSPDGTRLALAAYKNGSFSLRVMRWPDLRELSYLRCQDPIQSLRYLPDGRQLITAGTSGLKYLDAETLQTQREVRQVPATFHGVDFLADGQQIAVAEGRHGIGIRAARTGALASHLAGHNQQVLAALVNPNGRNLASLDAGRIACLWDLRTEKVILRFEGIETTKGGICFNRSGTRLAAIRSEKAWELIVFDAAPPTRATWPTVVATRATHGATTSNAGE